MNWREVIAKTERYLSEHGVEDGRVAAECLAARLLAVGRGLLSSEAEKCPSERELEAMRRGMTRLVKGEPLQYVLGEWDFRLLTLKCDSRALIPRPETEELVSRVLKSLNDHYRDGASIPFVVDVGTGTGAIILALAKEYRGKAIFLGTDISEDAIALARGNAEACGLADRVKFAVADGLDDFDEPECIDIIVSNPPYIASAVCETLDRKVRDFEPRMALDGGDSGLDFYERYLGDALNLLKHGGRVFFEIGDDQGEALRSLFTDYGFTEIRIENDFAGKARYASAICP